MLTRRHDLDGCHFGGSDGRIWIAFVPKWWQIWRWVWWIAAVRARWIWRFRKTRDGRRAAAPAHGTATILIQGRSETVRTYESSIRLDRVPVVKGGRSW